MTLSCFTSDWAHYFTFLVSVLLDQYLVDDHATKKGGEMQPFPGWRVYYWQEMYTFIDSSIYLLPRSTKLPLTRMARLNHLNGSHLSPITIVDFKQ